MTNPEVGVYLGHLCQDLDLVFFSKYSTFGIFYTSKEITSKSPPWPHKMPLETAIICSHPRTWNKFCKETEKIIDVGYSEGYELDFENNIRPAITEILDSIREVKKELLDQKLNEEIESELFVCNYCSVDGHKHCENKHKCKLRSD